MTIEEAKYILRNTAFLAPSLVPVDEAVDMACDALDKVAYINSQLGKADRKTENDSEKPNNCEPQTYVINPQEPTNDDKCFECDDFFTCGGQCNKTEDVPTGYNLSPVDKDINVRSKTEPQAKTKTETKNSNLTFEKRTMRDCYNCKRYETEGECIECRYEPKDEPQTERSE